MKTNKEQPLVGIAVPVYNCAKFLYECLESILNQTYTNWICIITDNASNDGSYEIAKEYESKDSRFRVYRNQETVIAYKNWNISIAQFKNLPVKYVKFECADDWMFPNCISDMVELHEKYGNLGAVYGYRLHGKNVDCDGIDIYNGEVFDGKEIILENLKQGIYIWGDLGSALFSKDAIIRINSNMHFINEKNIHCDIEMNDAIALNNRIGFVYKVLMYYRRHEGQILSFAEKYNTVLCEYERRFYNMIQYFPNDDELSYLYKQLREEYALFLETCKRKKRYEIVNWHNSHLERPILSTEISSAKKNKRKNIIHKIKVSIVSFITHI